MDKFWTLLEQSIIVQSIITVLVIGAYVVMVATGQAIDDTFGDIVMMVLVFWMGSKAGGAQATRGTIAQVKSLLGDRRGD